MERTLLVFGDKTFRIAVPEDAKVTFAPFSPPRSDNHRGWDSPGKAVGTLRIYKGSKENILACFSGVHGFRDLTLEYAEEVAREEGATIWKSDRDGYQREESVVRHRDWEDPLVIEAPKPKRKRRAK